MVSRMDRYKDSQPKEQLSRASRNKELYENIGSNTRYTNITDVTNANAYDLEKASSTSSTREGYHRIKEYQQPIQPKEQKELKNINYLYQDRENRIYDINRVLENAHKNRTEDEKEDKRKLKNTEDNIITSLSKEELENYRKERVNRVTREDEDEIKELIDTITSKTLAGEISKATVTDLFSDLMATNILDKVEAQAETDDDGEEENTDPELTLSKDFLDKKQIKALQQVKEKEEPKESKLTGADEDFYTRSMDLSDEDFEVEDEFEEEKTSPLLKIILLFVFIIAIAITIYFVWKNFG